VLSPLGVCDKQLSEQQAPAFLHQVRQCCVSLPGAFPVLLTNIAPIDAFPPQLKFSLVLLAHLFLPHFTFQ
jgi:hypothetical protein